MKNYTSDKYEPKHGDLLLTKDATPGIAYVVKENIEGIISSGILRLQMDENKINKEYLAICINSIVSKIQVERDLGGSVILHWRPDQVNTNPHSFTTNSAKNRFISPAIPRSKKESKGIIRNSKKGS